MSEIQTNSPIVQEKCFIHEQDTTIVPLSKEDVLVPGIADKHPRDMPEMAFVIAFCIQYNEAVGNLNFLPEELEDAIVRREPVDLVERIHRYFLRNVLNFPKIIDKRYWIRKLREHLHERIEKKEFIFSYNPFDRIKKNKYHELSNFEKVMILKDLVMWQFKGSEKIKAMWQFKESEKAQTLRPVEIEVLGVDSRESTYFYLGVGARIYREIPSADDTQQCVWEALTTTLQDLKELVSDRVEIDPDRSEEDRLLYKRISKELIPDVEYQFEIKRAAEEAARRKKRGKKPAKNKVRYNKSPRKVLSVEETDDENNIQADVTASDVGPALSVSMWSVTHPSTNLQPVQMAHDVRRFSANQMANSDLNGVTTSTTTVNSASQYDDDDDDDASTTTSSSIHEKNQLIYQSSFTERHTETSTPKNVIFHKRRMEEETSDDNDSNDSDYYLDSNKRVKFGLNNDDVMIHKSYYDDTTKRSNHVKGKGVLRNELHGNLEFENADIVNKDASKNKGKNVLRDEGPSQIVGSYMNHCYNTANVTNLSEVVDREIFRPGPEELDKLEWSLNHVFFEELEIFGEDSDSELSECCDACIMEVDQLLAH
ncbi:hypothetical protein GLOIN_2v1774962 [Rhizophagus irregularis DAOM 181602=DAOM 197198]|uniref:Uncharacterized protein n=3 Tax=Rhizophagus irregularis TaxID=588596 RepID=A0A015KYM4_RHIIW|nr:hypothetical protein GLOIN_2v1774962 [Rhizophagus irregularis DAOM 181602=DAOM 197198]EXX72698.1 hypothetical protein RirG_066860 [Rhizophagus irregularis DAOM 197198w]EXX72699.1 hypothetical protein RirG_066860 [Rhizophagus irregularis DAOM 197198w]POG71216.1 hypothetical protein GLOIN_2v1774962 [Rhizophagus irregularis DAOM 181602=DAOM 197198]|eukprot:XP_025178082.1 hypothetical protein GLOIN_2v1774962 [Rhizophagus irregularis DAOM 181602=DAOM 197198]